MSPSSSNGTRQKEQSLWRRTRSGRSQDLPHPPHQGEHPPAAEMERDHAAPEICDQLVIYRDEEVVLTAYEAGYDRGSVPTKALEDTLPFATQKRPGKDNHLGVVPVPKREHTLSRPQEEARR
jgi:hypothetical protein